ncbi:TPA: hypothetical protein ACG33P_004639, partial [Escherichia coli]
GIIFSCVLTYVAFASLEANLLDEQPDNMNTAQEKTDRNKTRLLNIISPLICQKNMILFGR